MMGEWNDAFPYDVFGKLLTDFSQVDVNRFG